MKLLVVGVMSVVLCAVLVAALLIGYREDQGHIPRFMGSGIAAKIDALGAPPPYVLIEDEASRAVSRPIVARDGTFVALLAPGHYLLELPNDARSVAVAVPDGECLDMVLDFRVPGVVLRIPGEGWPVPAL